MQDFLPVFAAGNYGARLVDGTIASPSTAKNCMSVGAVTVWLFQAYALHRSCLNMCDSLHPGASLTSLYKDSSSFPIYQPDLNINSVIYTATIVGGLKARLHVLFLQP